MKHVGQMLHRDAFADVLINVLVYTIDLGLPKTGLRAAFIELGIVEPDNEVEAKEEEDGIIVGNSCKNQRCKINS